MADEVNLHMVVPGVPTTLLAQWRTDPPDAFASEGFRLKDESYNSLTWERRYYDWPQKLMFVVSFGFALLFKGFMGSFFKVTARFDAEGPSATKVTISGTAHPRSRRKLTALADQSGGSVGLRVGV